MVEIQAEVGSDDRHEAKSSTRGTASLEPFPLGIYVFRCPQNQKKSTEHLVSTHTAYGQALSVAPGPWQGSSAYAGLQLGIRVTDSGDFHQSAPEALRPCQRFRCLSRQWKRCLVAIPSRLHEAAPVPPGTSFNGQVGDLSFEG